MIFPPMMLGPGLVVEVSDPQGRRLLSVKADSATMLGPYSDGAPMVLGDAFMPPGDTELLLVVFRVAKHQA